MAAQEHGPAVRGYACPRKQAQQWPTPRRAGPEGDAPGRFQSAATPPFSG